MRSHPLCCSCCPMKAVTSPALRSQSTEARHFTLARTGRPPRLPTRGVGGGRLPRRRGAGRGRVLARGGLGGAAGGGGVGAAAGVGGAPPFPICLACDAPCLGAVIYCLTPHHPTLRLFPR